MKRKWKAYLFIRDYAGAPPVRPVAGRWDYIQYNRRDYAISIARKHANDVAGYYSNLKVGPVFEEKLDNGGVLFRIDGLSNYERWPRVEPIDAD